MSAAFIFSVLLQALLYVTCSGEACLENWSSEDTKYSILKNKQDTYVYVSCKHSNFRVDGVNLIKCIHGELPAYLPQCILSEASCHQLKAPIFGSMKCDSTPPEVGSSCSFECQSSHYLRGSRSRTCSQDHRWTGSETRCHQKPECSEPPPLHHGTVTGCSPKIKPRYNDTCYFQCKEGFRLKGPAHLVCRLNGRLTDERGFQRFPRCLPVNPGGDLRPGAEDFRNPHPYVVPATYRPSCGVHNGYCSHQCHQEQTGVRCSCNSGYRLSEDGRTCLDIDECADGNNFGCSHLCINRLGTARCACPFGYDLEDDEKTCTAETLPVNPNSDVSSGGKEFQNTPPPVVPATYRSSCGVHNGYCSHQCHQEQTGVRCSCHSGYRLSQDRRTCIDIDECADGNNFGCSHLCINRPGNAYCACPVGYDLKDDRKTCTDVDECLDDKLNKCDHICENTVGGYNCSCRAGFISPNGFRCEGCRMNSYRTVFDVACIECPANSHTDGEGKASINDCICNSGFNGNPGLGFPCKDIDECADGKKFGCSHSCINTLGSAHCACPLGYQLKDDRKTCIDIDECSIKNGGCDGICHNTIGNFTCSCLEGYVASPDDRYTCDDVDECMENNGGCSQKCVNFKGGFHCSCSEGYHLHADGKSCIPIYCPRVSVPRHSTLRCKNSSDSEKDIFRPREMPENAEFPVGTVCRVKCAKGYDLQDANPEIICQNDGKWNAPLAECQVLQCPPLTPPTNGDVYPLSCKTGSSAVKQKCVFTCHLGYRIMGQEVLSCRNNLTWSKKKPTQCVPETEVSISCPDDDIIIELTPNEGWAQIQLNSPRTTPGAGPIRIYPPWVSLNEASIFPAGETEVTFSVTRDNKTAECSLFVIVLDKHPPFFPDCPETLFLTSSIAGTAVHWEEPVPEDNVGIASISKNLEPNSTLSPGIHFVEYIARDFAGNIGQCIFHINVTAGGCNDLADPKNGEANCMEWMFGKICEPTCFDNFTRVAEFFACDESGIWTPSEFISPCLPECSEDEVWSQEFQRCAKIT